MPLDSFYVDFSVNPSGTIQQRLLQL